MKRLGYLLIAAGTVAGSYFAVLDAVAVPWTSFSVALLVGAAGVALVQLGVRRHTQDVERIGAGLQELTAALEEVIDGVGALEAEKASLDPYEVHARIDATLPDPLRIFAEARESIAHVYDLQTYADVMSPFAAGERYLNRVWSASADGYIDEVRAYLTRALEQFEHAREVLVAAERRGDASAR